MNENSKTWATGRSQLIARSAGASMLTALALIYTAASAKPTTVHPHAHSRYATGAMTDGARQFYAMNWGVDDFSAKLTESGQLVRFSYRVIDAKKAAGLQDRSATPALLDEAAHVALQVPNMEKVGPLRQSMTAQEGKVYWIAFSNKGFPVKQGHRVSVAIGGFKVDGLVVQP